MNKEIRDIKDYKLYLKYLKILILTLIILAKSNTAEAQTTTIDFNQFNYPFSCDHKSILPPQPDPLTIGIATFSGGLLETGTNAICGLNLNCSTAYLTCDDSRLPEMTVTFAQGVTNLSFQIYNPSPLLFGNDYLITANGNQTRISIPITVGFATVSIPGTITNLTIVPTLYPTYSFYIDNLRFDAVVEKINSISFEAINSPIDNNPNIGGGLKIFPDKDTPNDTRDKTLVKIKAFTSLGAGRNVYFKFFDLDDPFTDDTKLDFNGAVGNDNRGEGKLVTSSSITDASGTAVVEFKVSKFAGDNFKVVASTDLNYLNSLTVTGIEVYKDTTKITSDMVAAVAKTTPMLTVWRRFHIELDFMDKVLNNKETGEITTLSPGSNGKVKSTFFNVNLPNNVTLDPKRFENGRIIVGATSYKVLNNTATSIEVEGIISPSSIAANTPFILFDDDDYNKDDREIIKGKSVPKPDGDDNEDVKAITGLFSLFEDSDLISKNSFAEAYIKPVFDGAGNPLNNNPNVSFTSNLADGRIAFENQVNLGKNSLAASDDYWVMYLQIAYQEDIVEDGDPDNENTLVGVGYGDDSAIDELLRDTNGYPINSPTGSESRIIFVEALSDINNSTVTKTTIPHEVGHSFGLKGDSQSKDIMGNDILSSKTTPKFLPNHLDIIRWRIHSPGKSN